MQIQELQVAAKSLLAYKPTQQLGPPREPEIDELIRRLSAFVLALEKVPAGIRVLERQVNRVQKARMPPSPFYSAMTKALALAQAAKDRTAKIEDLDQQPSSAANRPEPDDEHPDARRKSTTARPKTKCFRFTTADSKWQAVRIKNANDKRQYLLHSLIAGEVIFFEVAGSSLDGLNEVERKAADSYMWAAWDLMQLERKHHFAGSVLILACVERNAARNAAAIEWHFELKNAIREFGPTMICTEVQETVDALLSSLKGTSVRKRPQPRPTEAKRCWHWDDFINVIWFGTRYTFKGPQPPLVKILWKAWEDGSLVVTTQVLMGEGRGGGYECVADVFKGHDAWKKMIVPVKGRAGYYQLQEPRAKK